MAIRYKALTELYQETQRKVTAPAEWQQFLTSACRNYRLSFDEQLLVYAQRPDATAVLEIERWNKRFGRWVNRGANGIAVFDGEHSGKQQLKYYFDVSDTHEGRFSRPVPLWTVRPEYAPDIIEALENSFGELEQKDNLGAALLSAANNAVEDNIHDYLSELSHLTEGSFLEELDEYNVEVMYRRALQTSIGYMLVARCGLDPSEYFEDNDFRDVLNFNTPETLNALGVATGDISQMCLSEIARTTLALQRQPQKENRTFETAQENQYPVIEQETKQPERSNEYGRDHIQQAGRLQPAESSAPAGAGSGSWEIRITAPEVPEGEPQDHLHQSVDQRETEQSSGGDRADGTLPDGSGSGADGQDRGRDGGTESPRSDEVGATHEQPSERGGGNDPHGADLQLTDTEQADSQELPAFLDEKHIMAVIANKDDDLKYKKQQIELFFSIHTDQQERADYLKSAYQDRYTEIIADGQRLGYKPQEDGLLMWEGSYLSCTKESVFSWDLVARWTAQLIDKKEYFIQTDIRQLPTQESQQMSLFDFPSFGSSIPSEGEPQIVQEPKKAYDLGFGHLGNGLTVWNRLEEVDGDYRTVAHIAPDRTVQIYDEEMPQEIRERIQQVADSSEMAVSATQNTPVFSVPPREEPPQKEETADLYPVLAAQVLRLIGEFDGSRMGYGDDDAQAAANIAQQLHNTVQQQEIRALLQSFLDHTDPEEEIAADVALCMERINELPQPLTQDQALLEQAKELIDQFCQEEYDSYADFSDLEKVGIAYTTVTDEEIPIQVNVDLVNYRVERYLDGQFLERRQYDSLGAMVQNELTDLTFDDLISVSEEELESIGVSQDDYRLLSRLKADCDYYLGAGGRVEKHLWAGSVEAQIAKMRELYDVLSEKPEWLTEQDIDRYESQMTGGPELSQPQKEEVAPLAPKRIRRERVTFAPLYPEIPREQRHDFHITDNALGHGTPGEKFAANVRAIRCLKRIEAEERLATPEEQEILSRYVGWGGLPQCFEETHSKYAELKSLLDEDEYAAARASSLTAFYTPPIVIREIYKALSQMGFQQGNLLEPACGTGNFIGLLPTDMAGSKAYGVEIDSISGRIAQQLYQNANISVNGFETVQMPDSFFDVAIGNVPFGDFKVVDRRYDKHHWLIHDYFFGKALDKVRPGGIVAFITSKGTMDKENSAVRRYLAQRADLIGAIRLPDNTFKQNAGTEVTSDILFLQKRDHITDLEQDWVQLDTDENGIRMNRYFVQHPEMVLGDMVMESTRFGMDSACKAREGAELSEQLAEAIQFLQAEIKPYELEEPDEEDRSIPADPTVRNFSYTIVDGQVYYRENSLMHPMEVSVTAENRIRGMIELRECVRRLIEYQTEGYPDDDIQAEQKKLNSLYDSFTAKYGLISSRGNKLAFSEDSSYCLLCSLEVLDEQGNLKRKADMFSKRTIRLHVAVTSVDTASEALAVSISEKACVDMDYMAELSGKSPEELESELAGVIFRNIEGPENPDELRGNSLSLQAFSLVTADEYLSGNVRRKLRMAKAFLETAPDSQKEAARRQVEALEAVQPADLGAGEIGVRIGANWVPIDIYQQFMEELLTPGYYARNRIKILRSEVTGQWAITDKNSDRGNVKVLTTYGTKRMTAYHILEQTLNQKDVRVFDYIEDENGNKKAVLNKKETAIAQDRQELIKQKFSEWIWRDIDRRERLCRIYNETFNSIRPREYDGRHIHFEGMNPEISLRPHQINAIAHILYGGNTLLAHEVGAGKTYEMVAAAMEMKRLGLCTKSLIVVPNHITEQWAAEFLQLYPSANILVATKKDFEKQNRKKFCSRISTGDYDAIIIGHSQFEKIPMSAERQQAILQQQIDEILFGIEQAKSQKAERYTIKQMERTRKSLEAKLAKLNDQSRKDDVVTFEELGVDRIFIDESHYFKNLFLMTKMRNVGGIAQTEAQKSSDLFMKCQYLDELTGGRGVIFATGTPISNSMVELYTIQRYLQYRTLQEMGLIHFDDWASNFGETVTAIELSPEGSGYRAKTRFAKFYNLPELMSVFKQVADIQTADMLHLPVPKANFHTEVIKPSEIQQEMIKGLAERAEKIRGGGVDPHVDNMLRITNDGRKLALDMRLIQPLAPDDPDGKVAVCARNVYRIWEQMKEKRSTQLVFCDLSTPTTDGSFSVYDDLKKKLLHAGIPEDEIAFIHDADSEAKKKELFAKVRAGQVRILMGSTQKMGAGTNVQDRLIALHDLDCPWRPSDLQQRLGRIVRQGNENEEVEIFRYVTEGTFDAYLYQLVENKQKFIAQIMTSKAPVRVADDVDETALSYSEIKALATGNPLIIEKCNLDMEVARLNMLKASHLNQVYALEELVHRKYPAEITRLTEKIAGYEKDVELAKAHPKAQEGFCGMEVEGKHYAEKEDAGKAIIDVCTKMTGSDAVLLGQYRGFSMVLAYDGMSNEYRITLKGSLSHTVTLGADVFGNITRLDNALENLAGNLDAERAKLEEAKVQLENARTELATPFAREDELTEKTARLKELNILLNMDEKDKTLIDEAPDEGEEPPVRKVVGLER
ncbi:DNA methylase [Ruthenibacterium lactatiformans]|uniref:DNA methylase n=2 Tax=Ruthenibacterium lactatiformans TaxID=1550024 RepID=A0A6I2U744_9FIRM|nr:DNA methylase [Ruthenibacterium lactatiformans]